MVSESRLSADVVSSIPARDALGLSVFGGGRNNGRGAATSRSGALPMLFEVGGKVDRVQHCEVHM